HGGGCGLFGPCGKVALPVGKPDFVNRFFHSSTSLPRACRRFPVKHVEAMMNPQLVRHYMGCQKYSRGRSLRRLSTHPQSLLLLLPFMKRRTAEQQYAENCEHRARVAEGDYSPAVPPDASCRYVRHVRFNPFRLHESLEDRRLSCA